LVLFFRKERFLPYGERKMTETAFDSDPRIARILDIFSKETQTDRNLLRPDATLDELGVASLDLTMAVFEIESVFGTDIPVVADRAGAEFTTVGDLVSHVIAVLDKVPTPGATGTAG
jgi:acyl carrier protein